MAKDPNDFTEATKNKVLKRAGFGCSFPGCGVLLVGPHTDDEGSGTVFTGEVAHIQGARPAANNRYNLHMDPEQRSHHSNAIVLCRTHAKLIDSDEDKYTVDKIYSWKLDHQDRMSRWQAGENIHDEFINKPFDKCSDDELTFDREHRRGLIEEESKSRMINALKLLGGSGFFALAIFIWYKINGGADLFMLPIGFATVVLPVLVAVKLMDGKSEFVLRQENTIREIGYRLKERGVE
jgi:hypothetical protein